METSVFEKVQQQIQEYYAQGDYQSALEVAERAAEYFPEYAHLLTYWRSAMAARLGESQRAIRLIEQAVASGFWYGERLLRKSPSFTSLQGIPEFEEVVTASARMQAQEESQLYPLLVLRQPGHCEPGSPPCPWMIALHANAGTAHDSIGFWQPVAREGWLVGVPQSRQALWKGAYVWEDREQAAEEIQKHYLALTEQYNLESRRLLVAGHGLGAELAIWMALTGVVPVVGFLAIAPTGPMMADPEQWWPLIQKGSAVDKTTYLRAYLMVGEEDEMVAHENIERLNELLNQGGIESEMEEVPLAGHDYLAEFDAPLLRALAFLSERE